MPKLTHDLSLHVPTDLRDFIQNRSAALDLSINGYLIQCIKRDRELAQQCGECHHRRIGELLDEAIKLSLASKASS